MRIRSRSPYDNSTYELSPPQGAAPIRLNRNAGERSSIKRSASVIVIRLLALPMITLFMSCPHPRQPRFVNRNVTINGGCFLFYIFGPIGFFATA